MGGLDLQAWLKSGRHRRGVLSRWVFSQVQLGWRVYMIDGDIMDSPTQVRKLFGCDKFPVNFLGVCFKTEVDPKFW